MRRVADPPGTPVRASASAAWPPSNRNRGRLHFGTVAGIKSVCLAGMRRNSQHKHRNLLACAPERLHEEIGADYNDMIYAATPEEIEARREAFIRKWRLKHRAVADSLEEAATGSLHSPVCRQASGAARAQQTPSSGCTKSLSEGSKLKPCYPRQTPPRCCSGRCSRPVRSICERSMAGRRSLRTLSVSQLTWPPETIASCYRRSRHQIPTAFRTAPLMAASATLALKAAVWFRRGRLLIVSPDSLGTACPLSGRNSTYRPVQISGTSSQAAAA